MHCNALLRVLSGMSLMLMGTAFLRAVELHASVYLPRDFAAVAVVSDAAGNLYAGGSVATGPDGAGDILILKLSPDGKQILFEHRVRGAGRNGVSALVAGADGMVYATGGTESPDFPDTHANDTRPGVNEPRAFVLALEAQGTVRYATLLGGPARTSGQAIAVNAKGEALVGGFVGYNAETGATVPVTPGTVALTTTFYSSGFIAKLDREGRPVLSLRSAGAGPVAYDAEDNLYTAATVNGEVPITPGAWQSQYRIHPCGGSGFLGIGCPYQYIAKISADGKRLVYSTYLTGDYGATPAALRVDREGHAIVAGATYSSDYPVTPEAYQTRYQVTERHTWVSTGRLPATIPPPVTGFVTKLNKDGSGLV